MTHQGAVSKSGLNGAKPKVMMVLFVLWGEELGAHRSVHVSTPTKETSSHSEL